MKPIQICYIDNVIVDERDLANAEPCKQHRNRAASSAASHDGHAQPTQVLIECLAKRQSLPMKGRNGECGGAVRVVQG